MKIQKTVMQMLTLSNYNSHTELSLKKKKKIGDLLKLHELIFYFKYMHQNLPAYLLCPQIYTIITLGVQLM